MRVTSQTNLCKKARELAKFIRYRFKYSGIAIERDSLSLSLEGRRGLAVFILAEQPKPRRVASGKKSAVNSRSYLNAPAMKAKVLERPLVRSGLETLLTGGGAAALAYVIDAWLRSAFDVL